jgi:hypothetical protein
MRRPVSEALRPQSEGLIDELITRIRPSLLAPLNEIAAGSENTFKPHG